MWFGTFNRDEVDRLFVSSLFVSLQISQCLVNVVVQDVKTATEKVRYNNPLRKHVNTILEKVGSLYIWKFGTVDIWKEHSPLACFNPLRANYCHTWHMENHPFYMKANPSCTTDSSMYGP